MSGEEITISYVDPKWPTQLRRDTLKQDYGFDCRCQRCLVELQDIVSATPGEKVEKS